MTRCVSHSVRSCFRSITFYHVRLFLYPLFIFLYRYSLFFPRKNDLFLHPFYISSLNIYLFSLIFPSASSAGSSSRSLLRPSRCYSILYSKIYIYLRHRLNKNSWKQNRKVISSYIRPSFFYFLLTLFLNFLYRA